MRHVDAVQGAWAEFLGEFPLDTFFTLTYSDEYGDAHCVKSHTSALNDFERWLRELDIHPQYFVAAEPHFCRDIPHLHGLMASGGLDLSHYWASWFRTRGRGRFEEPRTDAVALYCSKYALKQANADTVRFHLERTSSRAHRARLSGVPLGL